MAVEFRTLRLSFVEGCLPFCKGDFHDQGLIIEVNNLGPLEADEQHPHCGEESLLSLRLATLSEAAPHWSKDYFLDRLSLAAEAQICAQSEYGEFPQYSDPQIADLRELVSLLDAIRPIGTNRWNPTINGIQLWDGQSWIIARKGDEGKIHTNADGRRFLYHVDPDTIGYSPEAYWYEMKS